MGARRRMTPEVSVTPVVEAAEPMDPLTFEVQNLRRVLEPTSIAVIGASDQSFFSRTVFENLKRSGFEGSIVPVNPSRSSVFGVKCYPDLQSAPQADVAVITVPREHVEGVLLDAIASGAAGSIVIAGGFRESGEPIWAETEARLGCLARRSGHVLIGPNCLGMISSPVKAAALGVPVLWEGRPGSIALAMQSGGLMNATARQLSETGAGVRYGVSVGNSSAFGMAEWVCSFTKVGGVRVIGLLVEGLADSWVSFERAVVAARAAGITIVVLQVGSSELGRAAATSHTGAIATDYKILRDAFRQAGVVEAENYGSFVGVLALYDRFSRKTGARGALVLSSSGGANGLIADVSVRSELRLPDLGPQTQAAMRSLGAVSEAPNPLDLGGFRGLKEDARKQMLVAALRDADIGIGIHVSTSLDERVPLHRTMLMQIAEAAADAGTPVILTKMVNSADLSATAAPRAWTAEMPSVVEALDTARLWLNDVHPCPELDDSTADWAPGNVVQWADEFSLKRLLVTEGAGRLEAPVGTLFGHPWNPEEVARWARGRTVILKAVGPSILHKSRLNLVRGPVRDGPVIDAAESLLAATRALNGAVTGLLVEEAVPSGTDLIVGVSRKKLGTVVMVGAGGVDVEAQSSIRFAMYPASAEHMTSLLRTVPNQRSDSAGIRSAEGALLRLVSNLADVMVSNNLSSIECNPVRITEDGTAWILDVVAIPDDQELGGQAEGVDG
jgi:acetate---CoA ligase (ADP-forming)